MNHMPEKHMAFTCAKHDTPMFFIRWTLHNVFNNLTAHDVFISQKLVLNGHKHQKLVQKDQNYRAP